MWWRDIFSRYSEGFVYNEASSLRTSSMECVVLFTAADVEKLGSCLSTVCSVEPSASALDSIGAAAPVSLHALHCLDTVHKEALVRHELLPAMFGALTCLAAAASEQPSAAVRCLAAAANLYRAAPAPSAHQLPTLMKALHSAVRLCPERRRNERDREGGDEPAHTTALLLQVLATGLPLAREHPDDYSEFWEMLPEVLETFMFEPPVGGSAQACEVVGVIRDEVLRGIPRPPQRPATRLLALVRAGSMHHTRPHTVLTRDR
nr:uncharacterized protein LOC116775444 [Danaus plexippus plexippus]